MTLTSAGEMQDQFCLHMILLFAMTERMADTTYLGKGQLGAHNFIGWGPLWMEVMVARSLLWWQELVVGLLYLGI